MTTETMLLNAAETTTRNYRVLHVLDHSWPVLSGYSVRSRSLVRAQRLIGFQPQVLSGPLHQLDDVDAADAIVDDSPYVRTPLAGNLARHLICGRWPVLRETAVMQLLRQRILDLIDSDRFDIIHAHSPALCGLAAWQAARSRSLPFVYEIRAFWEDAAVDQKKTRPQAIRYRASRQIETYVVQKADAVVGIALQILRDLQARGVNPEKLFHVSNGVDGDRFCPIPRDNKLACDLGLQNEVVLGFIGSLYPYEGISWLVPALARLRRRGVSCKLLILGEGDDEPAIATAIRETQSQSFVLPIGQVSHDRVQRYYSLIDVLVYPRRSTRLTELVTPLKPLEAMALGKPVLASSVGGILELVEHEQTGLLFKPDDIEDFCHQAERLIEQENLRHEIGSRAREKVLRERDWKVLAHRYERVYEFASMRFTEHRIAA